MPVCVCLSLYQSLSFCQFYSTPKLVLNRYIIFEVEVACNPTNLSTRANADVLLLSLLFFFKQKMSSIRILVLHYQWWARDSLLSVCVLSSIYIEVNPHTSRVLSSQIDTVLTWLVKVTSVNAKQRTFVFVTSLAFDVLQLEIKSEYNNIRAGIMGTVTQYKRMGWIEVLPTAVLTQQAPPPSGSLWWSK